MTPDAQRFKPPFGEEKTPQAEKRPLTPQQCRVVDLTVMGLNDKEIACEMKISRHTVDFHWRGIFAKTGVHSRIAAIVKCVRTPTEPRS